MTLQLHHPDGKGGLAHTDVAPDYRTQLRSPRWGKAGTGGKMPSMANPEMRPTPVWLSILFWVGLAAATFVILVIGYGVHFWS
ncbi:MAG TPA: hypothetical protein VKR30_00945 [Candidatus Limnocylindrales bacterium]|nr:hypothetical protein [Candidatus Limnocylindrales bacterium]